MKHLSKDQQNRLDEHVRDLRKQKELVEAAYAKITEAVEAINKEISMYNDILSEALSTRDEVVGEMDTYYSDRSERWQEGDAGSAYSDWKDSYDGLDLEPLDEIDVPDQPNLDHADDLEGLESEPSS
jgi:peptidoglycan hydrolase CwlO-like protein